MKFAAVATLVALAVSTAFAAGAQAPPAAKPDFRDKKVLDKWVADQSITQTTSWKRIAVAPEGLYLGSKKAEATVNPNIKTFVTRLELFEPINDAGKITTSVSFDHQIDCTEKTTRQVLLTAYPRHNLDGQPTVEKVEEAWAPVASDPMVNSIYGDFCDAARAGPAGGTRGMIGGTHGNVNSSRR
jgi:hypothetical protein